VKRLATSTEFKTNKHYWLASGQLATMDYQIRIGPSCPGYGEMLPPTPDAKVTLEEFQIYETVDPSNSSPKKRHRPLRRASETVAEARDGDSTIAETDKLVGLQTELDYEKDLLDSGAQAEAVASAPATPGDLTTLKDPSYFEDFEDIDITPLSGSSVSDKCSKSVLISTELAVRSDHGKELVLRERSPDRMDREREKSKSSPKKCVFSKSSN